MSCSFHFLRKTFPAKNDSQKVKSKIHVFRQDLRKKIKRFWILCLKVAQRLPKGVGEVSKGPKRHGRPWCARPAGGREDQAMTRGPKSLEKHALGKPVTTKSCDAKLTCAFRPIHHDSRLTVEQILKSWWLLNLHSILQKSTNKVRDEENHLVLPRTSQGWSL